MAHRVDPAPARESILSRFNRGEDPPCSMDPHRKEKWTVTRRSSVLLLPVVLLVLGVPAGAQVQMPQSTVASGGGMAADATQGLHTTLGPIAGGMAEGPQIVCRNGFWFSTVLFCSDADEPATPTSMAYWLGPGSPNPFRHVTSLQYAIPEACRVTIKLYDVGGRETATLVNQEQNPGLHTIVLDRTDLSSGVYFCRMTANRFSKTERLLLVR